MQSLQLVGRDHLKAILSGYPSTVLWGERRLEILAADRYFLIFFLAMMTQGRHRLTCGLYSILSTGREATSGTYSVEEALGVETSLDKGSPNMGVKAAPEIVLMLLLPWLDIYK